MEQYNVTGMSCAACSAHVEKAVRKVVGVENVAVSLLTNSMTVEGNASADEIISAVEKAGYGASLKGQSGAGDGSSTGTDGTSGNGIHALEDSLKDRETPQIRKRFIASLIILLPLMYLSMGHMMWNWPLPAIMADNHVAMGLVQLLLTTLIMVINQKFFISGFTSAIHGAPNMDTLVALGAGASYGYSVYALFAMTDAVLKHDHHAVMDYMHEFYFESAATILTLITLGKMMESLSKGRTTDALKGLMQLAPKLATLVRDGEEIQVPVEKVQIGNVFVVKPGESIPVDGIILEGNSALDESALTGESIPVDKTKGDTVSAATLNQSGYLKCEAVRVGEDTTLSRIIQMVSDAAATKAPIAKVADRVSGVFVPAVIVVAIVTFLVWLLTGQAIGFALSRAISVLVISCPCALGLATPVAIMVGNGVGAKQGILFKTAVSLEQTGKIDVIALDKTGTITQGKPVVTNLIPVDGIKDEELIKLAYALEKKSEHPLAHAIVEYVEKEKTWQTWNVEVEDFEAVPGNGLTAKLDGEVLSGGNLDFILRQIGNKGISEEMQKMADELAGEGKTPLFFCKGKKNEAHLAGIIAVADVMKEDSAEAVKELQNMGIRVVMLTGDNERTANAIGKQAGVDEVIAGVLPDGKESVIRRLQEENGGKCIVAMVGDGINDAPALTRADIGIAIGAGTDIAIDAADVVLMKSSLKDAVAAIRLSRATLRNIHQNLFWAFFYNVIGIPLAAGVYYPFFGWKLNPMFGAAAMSLSSFCVVTNALRLNLVDVRSNKHDRKKRNKIEQQEKTKELQINKNTIEENKNQKVKETNLTYIKNEKMEENKMERTMVIEGMMCGHCEASVKKALEALSEVSEAIVSHEEGTAIVKLSAEIANGTLKQTVEDLDYKVVEIK